MWRATYRRKKPPRCRSVVPHTLSPHRNCMLLPSRVYKYRWRAALHRLRRMYRGTCANTNAGGHLDHFHRLLPTHPRPSHSTLNSPTIFARGNLLKSHADSFHLNSLPSTHGDTDTQRQWSGYTRFCRPFEPLENLCHPSPDYQTRPSSIHKRRLSPFSQGSGLLRLRIRYYVSLRSKA